MPSLTQLEFVLDATLPVAASDSPLVFSNLHEFALHAVSLELISRFLSRVQLPVITGLGAVMGSCPSRNEVSSFSASVQTSNAGHTIERLRLDQPPHLQNNLQNNVRCEALLLCLQDLRPFMAFNLRQLKLNIGWNVDLTDNELLALASAWPHLETLLINEDWGWNTECGSTPNGLLQLLQTCQSLSEIGLAIDTRGYTEYRELPASLGVIFPPGSAIRIPDAMIEVDSMPAVTAFFASLVSCSDVYFSAWSGCGMIRNPQNVHKDRWDEVLRRVMDAISRRS